MPTARIIRPTRTNRPTRNSDHVNCLRCAIPKLLRACASLLHRPSAAIADFFVAPAAPIPPDPGAEGRAYLHTIQELPEISEPHKSPFCQWPKTKSGTAAGKDHWQPGVPR